jgi:hypothetical protein
MNFIAWFFCVTFCIVFSQTAISQAITVQSSADTETLPLSLRYKKIYIDVSLNGQDHTLIFDTGSPTLIT